MWNCCSDDNGSFFNLNKIDKNDIKGASGTHLARRLTVFSNYMLSESKTDLDGLKSLVGFHHSCRTLLEQFVLCCKLNYSASCVLLKYQNYETILKGYLKNGGYKGKRSYVHCI